MIPLKLTLSGIYSYKEKEQTIDFARLTSDNIFGIFGKVGSGKSTILEAMIFALYGNAERMGRNNAKYNMMNLSSNNMLIDFEFIAGENNDEYRIVVKSRRNSKDFAKIGNTERRILKKEGGQWIEIGSDDNQDLIENIIGLSHENFRRVIIIPQGKFQDFLQLGNADRAKMLKEIFPELRQYDLSDKIKILLGGTNNNVANISGQLTQLEDITEQALTQETETAEKLKKQLAETETKKSYIEEKNNLMNNLLKLTSEYDSKKKELNDLSSQKPKIEEKEQMLKQYNECMSLFAEDIATRKKSISNINTAKTNLEKIIKVAEEQEKLAADTKQKFEQYEAEYNKRERKQNTISALELVMKINTLLKETAFTEKQKTELDNKQKSTEKAIIESESKKTTLAAEHERLQASAMEVNELIDLQAWLTKYTALLTDRNSKQNKLAELLKEEEELQKTINDFLAKREYLKGYEPTINSIGLGIENKINSLNDCIRKETEELQKLQVKQELYHYSTALHEGEPCPLCGSTHHPTVANHNVENEIKELKTTIDKLSSEKENLATKGLRWVNTKTLEQTNRQRQTAELNAQLCEIETEIGKQIEAFRWQQFSHSDSTLEEKLNIENQKIKQIELLSKEIVTLEKQLSSLREEKDKHNTAIQALSNTILTNQTIVGEQIKNVGADIWEKYKNSSENEINTLIHTLRTNIQQTETNYQRLKTLNTEHTATLHQLQGQKESTEKQLADFENDLKEIDNKLICKINIGQYQSINEVEKIINQNLDSNAITEEINNFNNNMAVIEKRLAELATLIGTNTYNPEEHKALKLQLENIAEEEKTLKENQAVCNAKIKNIAEKLTIKQHLAKEYDELTKRKTNLETLQKIFKASGFVDYVSTIYLENLVRTANERFRKMTKQQLELILNEDNEFEIRDYLNEGKVRSVKTLSGGQTFQVSLALALALIDNIHCFANNSKKFFFLDEGFGSQDKDSLNIIFDTLKSLRNENRVVGIISHVEELQQRIPTNIHIVHSEEKGSIIGNF